jgi:hypothetical protein
MVCAVWYNGREFAIEFHVCETHNWQLLFSILDYLIEGQTLFPWGYDSNIAVDVLALLGRLALLLANQRAEFRYSLSVCV